MQRTRHILVLTLVATVLCADHVATAAPQPVRTAPVAPTADPIARLATNLASRLTGTFHRERENSAVVRLQPSQRQVTTVQPAPQRLPSDLVAIHQAEGSPFRFRLPPPLL